MSASSDQTDYKKIRDGLSTILGLVKDGYFAVGFGNRVEDTDDTIGAGEYELAYANLCENIHEFDIPVSDQAYELFVQLWNDIGYDVQKMFGKDWHYLEFLGTREGFPGEPIVPPRPQGEQERKRVIPFNEIPPKYLWNSEPNGLVNPGNIEKHDNWHLTGPIEKALQRLAELGVTIYSTRDGNDYTYMVPHQLFPEQNDEIEILMNAVAQEVHSFVDYVEWYPHGRKFRTTIPR